MFKSNQNGMNTFELNSFSRHWIRTTRFSSKNRSFQSIQIISIWENVFHFGFWCKVSCLKQLFLLTCETCRKIVQFSLNMNRKKNKRKYSTTCLSMCKMLLDFARSQTNCMQHKYEQVASTLKLLTIRYKWTEPSLATFQFHSCHCKSLLVVCCR